jgi:hypothetical protein
MKINAMGGERGKIRKRGWRWIMVGITLSAEQLRAAPPEVRRWIEHEVAVSLGLHAPEVVDAKRGWPQLVGLTVDEVAKVLSEDQKRIILQMVVD